MVDQFTRRPVGRRSRASLAAWALLWALGAASCGDTSEIPDSTALGPVRGQAAELRDGIAFIPGTQRRYTGPLVTYYWNGEYVRAYYRNGVQDGPWARYSQDHQLLQQVCFESGVAIPCRD